MHKPAIVVGTVDSLVSKALNRGYGIGRAIFPIDFALAANGAQWVIDEVQLCPESATTLRQLAGFAGKIGTAEPFGLTCMSATVPAGLLETVDNPVTGSTVEILPDERRGELAVRLDAARAIRRTGADPGDYKALADPCENCTGPARSPWSCSIRSRPPAMSTGNCAAGRSAARCCTPGSVASSGPGGMAEVVTRSRRQDRRGDPGRRGGHRPVRGCPGDGGSPVAVPGAAGRPVQPHRDDAGAEVWWLPASQAAAL